MKYNTNTYKKGHSELRVHENGRNSTVPRQFTKKQLSEQFPEKFKNA